jgi:Zn-dependent metalloprotease
VKFLRTGLAVAMVGVALSATPAAPSLAAAPTTPKAAADDPSLLSQMRQEADGTLRSSTERATGKLGFVGVRGADDDLLPGVAGRTVAQAVSKADGYLADYAKAFGADSKQLVRNDVSTDGYGRTITYVQRYQGINVYGAELRAHVARSGELTSVNGELVPLDAVDTTADLSAAEAGKRAVALVKAQPPATDGKIGLKGLRADKVALVVYKRGLLQGLTNGATELVYQVEVTNGSSVRDMVFVNADTGKVVNRYTMLADALERELYEESPDTAPVWKEGDPFPGDLNDDQQNLVRSAGETYWLYRNTFGRDSYDGEGAVMKTVNNDPRISCPNANWNGVTTNYCDGVTSDDVVSHEWTHAYTEYTHGLIYQWQSGAINEGYSDIFGETLDLLNEREDEGEGDINAQRPDGLCSQFSPARPLLTINAPSEIAKDCLTGGASFGEQLDAEGITGDVVVAADAAEAGGTTTDGCSDYTNQAEAAGKIVMVDRGLCSFVEKAQKATEMGAAALIIGNRDDAPIGMSGDNPDVVTTVSIGLTDRESIRDAVEAGETVNVTMRDASGDDKANSYRWLIGEKSGAFGGAIRDMWNPTCYGDPGKVSDAEYKCSTDDNGGVHGNSGVVNHGYALLVDGGTSNGVTVQGLGFDKALNIYYRAMTEYQTPASNFVDHADSLYAACTDLVGKAYNKVEIGGPGGSNAPVRSTKKISLADCDQVNNMAEAVEFRLDPTEQCGWQPLFEQGAPEPADCGDGSTVSLLSEDFESGLTNWSLSSENPFGGLTQKWKTVREQDYYGDHTSAVAYGPAPDRGACDGSTNDFSSVDYMTSPVITVPANASSPRMAWEHSIASEVGFDGGTVQVKVADGDWETVPADAYTFNAPGQISTAAEGNTNPLAGEPGFTGTDPNKLYSEWGTSAIDLTQLETPVAAGEEMQVRFAIGRDGCGGSLGWFVDNVELVACADDVPTVTAQRHTPEPVTVGEEHSITATVTGTTADVVATIDGTEVGRATPPAEGGTVTIDLPTDLPVGTHEVTLTSGSASDTITITIVAKPSAFAIFQRTPEPSTYGEPSILEMLLEAEDATGTVTVRTGGQQIGTGEVDQGYAGVELPATLPAGNHTLRVIYSGDDTYAPTEDTVAIVINKAGTTATVTQAPKTVKRTKTATVRVKVAPSAATGNVVLKANGTSFGSAKVVDGVAKVTTRKLNKVGTYRMTATYQGDRNHAASTSAVFVVKVVK